MPADDIKNILEDLGLNGKEIAVYLMLLQVGTSPASTLGDRTGIVRSTAQYTCQQLERKGLVRMVQKGNTYLYTPEPPEKLVTLLAKQKDELERKEGRVNRIIGELKGMMNPHAVLPKIRFFEGRDGVREAYAGIIAAVTPQDEILSFLRPLDFDDDPHGVASLVDEFARGVAKKGAFTRNLSLESAAGEKLKRKDAAYNSETRFLHVGRNDVAPVEILFFRDFLYAMTIENGHIFAYMVQNKSMTGIQRLLFEVLWKAADR